MGHALDPTFFSTTYEYEVEVPYAVEILTVNVSAPSRSHRQLHIDGCQ